MTRDEFAKKYLHEFCGMLLESWADQRRGSDASMWLQASYRKIHSLLGAMYDSATAAEKPPADKNGQAKQQSKPSPHTPGGQ